MMPELTKNPMPVGAISHKGYRITDEEAQGIPSMLVIYRGCGR